MFELEAYLIMLRHKGHESRVELHDWKETYVGVFASYEWFANYLNMPSRPEARHKGKYGIFKDGTYMFWPVATIKRVSKCC